MAKFQSPLLGYNNNVRHRGRVFHIQTEDSGVNHPHIITHLFMDGGRILKSVKKSYAEHVGTDNMSETVRVLMKEQHKAMFVALRDGQFDSLFEAGKKPSGAVVAPVVPAEAAPAKAESPAPSPPAAPPAPVTPPVVAAVEAKKPSVQDPLEARTLSNEIPVNTAAVLSVVKVSADNIPAAPRRMPVEARPLTRPDALPRSLVPDEPVPATINEHRSDILSADPPLPPELEALLRDELPPRTSSDPSLPSTEPKTTREPRRSAQELTLDFDALERDSGESPIFQQQDLPPPPKNLFAKEPRTGQYSTVDSEQPHQESGRPPLSRPSIPSASRTPPPPSKQGQKPGSEGRYAPARPAAIFGAPNKQQPSPSIFSDDLVSDKSLDEVILSYLAEDLDPPRRK
ncbi:MAG: hypothetical protein K0S65_3699 [Labilithrix sp.]|nr:hypothetical protein [Labilithrix sp.]